MIDQGQKTSTPITPEASFFVAIVNIIEMPRSRLHLTEQSFTVDGPSYLS